MPMTSSDTKVRDEALLALVGQRLADATNAADATDHPPTTGAR